jgi:hypothetical protein
MVVGPGSLHPSGVRYTVIMDVPIASISQEVIEKIKQILSKPTNSKNHNGKSNSTSDAMRELKLLIILKRILLEILLAPRSWGQVGTGIMKERKKQDRIPMAITQTKPDILWWSPMLTPSSTALLVNKGVEYRG